MFPFTKKKKTPFSNPKVFSTLLREVITANDISALEEILANASTKELLATATLKTEPPLHYAVTTKSLQCVLLLLKAKADVNRKNKITNTQISYNHQTPLHVACLNGYEDIVEALLQVDDVEIQSRDYHRDTPSRLALRNGYKNIAAKVETRLGIYTDPILCLNQLKISKTSCIFREPHIFLKDHLQTLDLSENRLCSIPNPILNLENLTCLHLTKNKIQIIPGNISKLGKLKSLHLDHNEIDLPPLSIITLPSIKTLHCCENPLHFVPLEKKTDNASLFRYLKSFATLKEKWSRMKLLVVGESGVGKTSLVKSLTRKFVLSPLAPRQSCIQESKDSKNVQVYDIPLSSGTTLAGWDLGAADMKYSLHQFYMTGRTVYIITMNVYQVNAQYIDFWLQSIRLVSVLGKSWVIAIATKTDDRKCTPKVIKSVSQMLEEYKQKGSLHSFHFINNRTRELPDPLQAIKGSLEAISQSCQLINKEIPATWILLDNRLALIKRKHPFISIEFFHNLCKECQIKESTSLLVLLDFLRDTGRICYDTVASSVDFIIIRPEFLTCLMKRIATYFEEKKILNGMLQRVDVPVIWDHIPDTLYDSMLGSLCNYEIGYLMRGKPARYLFPSILTDILPSNVAEFWPSTIPNNFQQYGRIYRFKMPASDVFRRLILRFLHIANMKDQLLWKRGIILQLDKEISIVTFDSHRSSIVIKVRAAKTQKTVLLRALIACVDSLIESVYQGFGKIDVFVPCLHCIRHNQYSSPFKFTKNQCIKAWTTGAPFVYCHNIKSSSRCVRVDILAPDLSFGDITVLSEVTVGKVIGKGGFGMVYDGIFESNRIAIKELHAKDVDSFAEMFEEFSREVYTMSSLEHPNLVQLFGIMVNPLRMVMEFVPSGDLYHILHSEHVELSLFMRLRIALDVAQGMGYLQDISPPIMHRDLRSPNILIHSLDPKAPVIAKVADFGLALSVAPLASGFLGTWQWHAPEVLDTSLVYYDESADIYSFGIVLWEIFTSGYPFEEYRNVAPYGHCVGQKNDVDVWLFRIQNIKRGIITKNLRPTFNGPEMVKTPPLCQQVVEMCWSPKPKDRPPFPIIIKEIMACFKEYYPERSFILPTAKREKRPESVISYEEKFSTSCNSLDRIGETLDVFEKPLCIHYAQNKVWVGCDKGNLLVFDAVECSLITSSRKHRTRIYSIISFGPKIWCSSESGIIYIYDGSNCAFHSEFIAHENSFIRQILCNNNSEQVPSMWTCSPQQRRICVWNPVSIVKQYIFQLDITINCMYIVNELLWVGTHKDILVFSVDYENEKLKLEHTLDSHTRKVNQFILPKKKKNEIWSCSDDGSLCAWSTQTFELIKRMDVNSGAIRSLVQVKDTIWSGGSNNAILVWDVTTYSPLNEWGMPDSVLSLCEAGSSMWAGTADFKLFILPNKYI